MHGWRPKGGNFTQCRSDVFAPRTLRRIRQLTSSTVIWHCDRYGAANAKLDMLATSGELMERTAALATCILVAPTHRRRWHGGCRYSSKGSARAAVSSRGPEQRHERPQEEGQAEGSQPCDEDRCAHSVQRFCKAAASHQPLSADSLTLLSTAESNGAVPLDSFEEVTLPSRPYSDFVEDAEAAAAAVRPADLPGYLHWTRLDCFGTGSLACKHCRRACRPVKESVHSTCHEITSRRTATLAKTFSAALGETCSKYSLQNG